MNLLLRYLVPVVTGYLAGIESRRHLKEVFSWSTVDFAYPSIQARELALSSGSFLPKNNLPLGLEVYKDRLFITLPKWKKGIPATLTSVHLSSPYRSPLLEPYPNWAWHSSGGCSGLTSVFRVAVDECHRLWVLDSGTVEVASRPKSLCPVQLFVFDLKTDQLVWRYTFPKSEIPPGALLVNIAVELRNNKCDDAFIYASDVFRYGLHVYSLKLNSSWKLNSPFFHPDPFQSFYDIDGIQFQWTDGIFSLALSPPTNDNSGRTLFFHPLSSNREFSIPTSYLHNETLSKMAPVAPVGDPRKKNRGQSTASAMDNYGVLFYNLVSKSAVGCWNSQQFHAPYTQGIIARDNVTLSFPNDLKLDREREQSLWVLSNRLHRYIYASLNPQEINFRVLTVKVKDAIHNTPCDPLTQKPLRPQRKLRNCIET